MAIQHVEVALRPGLFVLDAQQLADLVINREGITKLESNEDGLALLAQADAVVPIGGQAARQAMRAGALQVEFDGPLHVT